MDIQSLLGTNHHLPLSHMYKSYIWLEETNLRINELSIGYMMNPNLSINKAFKEKVKIFMKTTFGTMTQQHISKILPKPNTRVLALVMFYETRQKNSNKMFKVLSCVIYTITRNYVYIDYLGYEKTNLSDLRLGPGGC